MMSEAVHAGLTSAEATRRLSSFGANELRAAKPKTAWRLAWETAREPMFLLLIACASLYLLLGDLQESLILGAAVVVVVAITFFQERRTERTLEALRDLSSPRALVIRDGAARRIPGREVVVGDVMMIGEGDRVPADAALLEANGLQVDESLLTGESVAVGKARWNGKDALVEAGGEGSPFVYSGTLVVRGRGVARVLGTGEGTSLGRIGAMLAGAERPKSALQIETRRVVRYAAAFSIGMSLVMTLILWRRDGDLLRGFLTGLTFAMATIPEEFPVVLTVFMAIGAWRISRQNVLTRQASAIEALGAATFLCVDKTGTLTMNRMRVAATAAGDEAAILHWGALASEADAVEPMDRALVEVGGGALGLKAEGDELRSLRIYPFSKSLLVAGRAWGDPAGKISIAVKGAPEAVIKLCGLDEAGQRASRSATERLAERGLRVLGIACGEDLPQAPERLEDAPLRLVGFVAFADPLRPGVTEAVDQCRKAGISVMMITGDYPTTAASIARSAGIANDGEVLTGSAVARLDDEALQRELGRVRVLARMVPEQKLRVVRALAALGEVVAMTGDGVNDAPALKAAHIGIAMGARGTDVARESAALVLLDDDFSSIVAAIRLGRRIYDNIQKAVTYIIAIHVPIVGLTVIPVLLGMPSVLVPVHLAFLELIIDPVCSLAFEAEAAEASVMARPPRPAGSRLFDGATLARAFGEGAAVLAAVFAVYVFAATGFSPTQSHARAMSFTTLLLGNLGLILSLRTRSELGIAALRRPSRTLLAVTASLVAVAAFVLYEPHVASAFKFAHLGALDLLVCGASAGLALAGFELAKVVRRRRRGSADPRR